MNFTLGERQRESFLMEFEREVSLEEVSRLYQEFTKSETSLSARRGANGLYWLVETEQKPHLVIQTPKQSENSGFEVWYHFFCKDFIRFYKYMKKISTKQEK